MIFKRISSIMDTHKKRAGVIVAVLALVLSVGTGLIPATTPAQANETYISMYLWGEPNGSTAIPSLVGASSIDAHDILHKNALTITSSVFIPNLVGTSTDDAFVYLQQSDLSYKVAA